MIYTPPGIPQPTSPTPKAAPPKTDPPKAAPPKTDPAKTASSGLDYLLNPLGGMIDRDPPPPSKESIEQKKRLKALDSQLAKRRAELKRLQEMTQKQQRQLKDLKKLSAKEKTLIEKEKRVRLKLQKDQTAELKSLRRQHDAEKRRLKRLQNQASRAHRLLLREKNLARQQRRLARLRLLAIKNKHRKTLLALKAQEKNLNTRMRKIRKRRVGLHKARSNASKAQEAFNAGKLKLARTLFSTSDKSMVKMIEQFKADFREGSRESRNRNPARAIPRLERALMSDLELGGGHSVYTRNIKAMLGNMHVFRGLMAMSRRSFESAFLYFNVAKRYSPKHRTIRANLKQLRIIAQKYFAQAKRAGQQHHVARRYLQKVIRLVYPHDPLYKRARALLESF